MVPARFATPRDPGRRTMGPAVGRIATALGMPLMPWPTSGERSTTPAGSPTRW
jgi:hypothetical protein